jgi:hypothetical protein
MPVGELTVDSTYRWVVVLLMAAALAACLIPGAYRTGFRKTGLSHMMTSALVLIGVGIVLAPIFGESIVDAVLLRARFGFMVPDTGIHGYGWAFVFGYSMFLSSVTTLLVGVVMVAMGKVPPWIDKAK